MIVADGVKRFRGSFHGVVAQRTVHVKIDKAGREIISMEVDDRFAAHACGAAAASPLASDGSARGLQRFSFFNDDLEDHREFHREKSNARS